MNEYCQVIAQWFVQTKSWTEVELGLQRLKQRYADLSIEVSKWIHIAPFVQPIEKQTFSFLAYSTEQLMCVQLPRYMYVDDVEQSAPSLRRLLGDDLVVLEDSTHFMRRYLATIPDHHPLKGEPSSKPACEGHKPPFVVC